MFGSYVVELAIGVACLIFAVVFWRYMLRAFRRTPLPAVLRVSIAGEASTLLGVGLLALGTAFVIDALARAIP